MVPEVGPALFKPLGGESLILLKKGGEMINDMVVGPSFASYYQFVSGAFTIEFEISIFGLALKCVTKTAIAFYFTGINLVQRLDLRG